ncbi:unnamed protein product [Schistosoma mattheei]|uniref:Uncharacterized protein n=1 Tax=Schistosoma mattheei TaxID=31246 RepID=A0A183P4Q3_9TREM|nr:unnamed protein product [Schistosoma mattheei]
MKSGKAEGSGNIPAEAVKSDTEATSYMLHILFRRILEEEQVLTCSKEKYFFNIPEKGDLSKRDNYTSITLLSLPVNSAAEPDERYNGHPTSRSTDRIPPRSDGKHEIQSTARNQLEDSDFADDLALLSHTYQQIQVKAISVAEVSASVGKTTILQYNMESTDPITLDGEAME